VDRSKMARAGRKTKWRLGGRSIAIVFLATLGMFAFAVGSASASVLEYENLCAGLAPPAICTPGGIPGARGVAVNDTTGDVYVGLVGEIKHFSEKGAALPAITGTGGEADWLAVDNSGGSAEGDIYASFFAEGKVKRFTPAGALDTTFATNGVLTTAAEPAGIAVDPSNGHVYVATRGDSMVHVYDSTGTAIPAESFPISGGAIDGLSVDTGGNAFIVYESSSITEYPASNRATPTEVGPGTAPTEVAVDTSPSGHVFVFGGGVISVFEKTGAHGSIAASFAPGGPGLSYGMAATKHFVYVADISNGDVVIFKEHEVGPPPPPPVTGPAEVNGTSAKLHGTMNVSEEESNSYYFEYKPGVSCSGGKKTATEPTPPGVGVPVEATVSELTAKTEYTFCLVAENSNGATQAENVTSFTTGVGAPVVKEETSSEITPHTVTVSAKINPSGEATTCEVEYGETEAYGTKVPCPALAEPEAITDQSVSVPLSGLEANKPYHYRFVAENLIAKVPGSDATFTTQSLAAVITEAATEIQPRSAKFNGSIAPNVGGPVEYLFEYGEGPVGAPLPEKTSTTAFAGNPASTLAEPIKPGTTYHYRLVAIVEGTEVKAENEQEFTTPPLVEVQNEPASEVKSVSAKLNGHITNGIEASHYYFAYGKEGEPLSNKTPETAIAASKSESVSATVNGLTPNTHYEAQLVAVVTGNVLVPAEPPVKFTTKVAAPVVINKPPLSITRETASLSGEINTEEGTTEYFVEYGETEAYGRTEPISPLSLEPAVGPTKIPPVALSELHAGKVYHYRIVAKNETATTDGQDATFETAAAQPPIVESESSAQVTQTTATILAVVNANGLQTMYTLEIGTDTNYGTPTFGEVGSETTSVALGFGLTGLLPGTTYHYRIVLQNADGTVPGADQTFTTPGFPPVIVPPPAVQIIPTPPQPKEVVKVQHTKLEKALELCAKKPKKQRAACVRKAHKKYGPKPKKKTKKKK
jgi:hypothetical protein